MKRLSLIFILILFFQLALSQPNAMSWKDIKKSGRGTITVYWFPNEPYGFTDDRGKLRGIEVEILQGFQKYLADYYKIDLSLRWVQEERFIDVLNRIKSSSQPGDFGIAGFSFTEERRTFMKFSPSYMADIAVLVSTPDISIAKSPEDLKKSLKGTTALTAKGTILEKELEELRSKNNMQFNIEFTGGSVELINVLSKRKKSFGYLNLAIYLSQLEKGLTRLNRQNHLTKSYEGRGIGLPFNSDWDEPLNEYFASADFKKNTEAIISKYINTDLFHFIKNFNPDNEVSLLNKEKDIQQMEIKIQKMELEEKNQRQTFLTIIIVVVSILLCIIVIMFRKQLAVHKLLKEQKAEIEAQSDEILSINDNLELTVSERTRELEHKNKSLQEYAFITAHKLRAPLASILGLVALIDKMDLKEEDKILIAHLDQSAKNLDVIIHSIMDAIDKSDSKNQNSEE